MYTTRVSMRQRKTERERGRDGILEDLCGAFFFILLKPLLRRRVMFRNLLQYNSLKEIYPTPGN